MIFRNYKHYNGNYTSLNADFTSTEMYLKNRSLYHYNSFVFGSSRTLAYKASEWKKYLSPSDLPFVYHASYESLYGILAKLKFIDKQNDTIKNALFILDETILWQITNSEGHLFIKDPRISGDSKLQFYNTFFRAYLSDFFFVKCIDYSLFKTKRPYMKGFFCDQYIYLDPITNDLYPMGKINDSKSDPVGFYQKFRLKYPKITPVIKTEPKIIDKVREEMLVGIKELLDKHHTDYKIVISPKYNCYKLHPDDQRKLEEIFGKNTIHDFSGVNKYTTDIHTFYEPFHYTIETGKTILEEIYSVSN